MVVVAAALLSLVAEAVCVVLVVDDGRVNVVLGAKVPNGFFREGKPWLGGVGRANVDFASRRCPLPRRLRSTI